MSLSRPGIAAVAACSPALFASYGDTSRPAERWTGDAALDGPGQR
jgi:hypothetical protein